MILYNAILFAFSMVLAFLFFYCGKILGNVSSFRSFLGLSNSYNDEDAYKETAYWLYRLGKTLEFSGLTIGALSMLAFLVSLLS